MEDLTTFLKQVLILEECSPREATVLGPYLKPKLMKKGEILFNQGEEGSELFIVEEGIIGCHTITSNGSMRDVARFSRGQSFGEMAVTHDKVRTTTCYALTDCRLQVLKAADFKEMIRQHPHTGIKIYKGMLRNMVTWLTEANDFLTNMCIWGEKARLRAITDDMTGLYNHRFFEETIETSISKAKRKKEIFSVLMCDIDNFHHLNKAIGTEGGDIILRSMASVFKSSFTGSNIAAKLGGDEFAALLPGLNLQAAIPLAERFKNAFQNRKIDIPPQYGTLDIPVTISVGIAEFPAHGDSARTLKEAADQALYKAKELGKNRVATL